MARSIWAARLITRVNSGRTHRKGGEFNIFCLVLFGSSLARSNPLGEPHVCPSYARPSTPLHRRGTNSSFKIK